MNEDEERTRQFIREAEAYCALIESREEVTLAEFLRQCQRCLLALCQAAMDLPPISPSDDEWHRGEMSHEEWAVLFRDLGNKLGEHDVYWEVFDPTDADDHESITTTLSDDLADVYRDLKDGLVHLASSPEHRDDIAWQWGERFHWHWGNHATDAIRVLQRLLYGNNGLAVLETDTATNFAEPSEDS